MKLLTPLIPLTILTTGCMLLTACGGDNDRSHHSSSAMNSLSVSSSESSMSSSSTGMMSVKYSVTITNLTAGQPLSPTALLLHKPGYHAFTIGEPASVELEYIAEGGNPDPLLEDLATRTSTYVTTRPDEGIAPGGSTNLVLETMLHNEEQAWIELSALSMLGNTNDGFTGINALKLGQLAVGESMTLDSISYDAGTEQNSETDTTVPGPAAGGEGFNAGRDDPVNLVAMHSGVLTRDDGNSGSTLTSLHRWDNPVARITITRLAP